MAKKRYYGGGPMKSESSSKKMKANKKEGKAMKGMDDQSMFGFPASSKVVEYPKVRYMNQNSGAERDGLRGMDYEMDMTVEGLNKQKSKYRW